MNIPPSPDLIKIFNYVLENNIDVADRFFKELYNLHPQIEFKFEDQDLVKLFTKLIKLIKDFDREELLNIGKLHKNLDGFHRKDFSYISTCLFNTLIDTCHYYLTKSVIRELNIHIDRAMYILQEGFID